MLAIILYLLIILQCGICFSDRSDLTLARLVTEDAETEWPCLEDGDYCWGPEECCSGPLTWLLSCQSWPYHAGECSHHWPPTTTPVFGECGPVPECQVRHMRLVSAHIWWSCDQGRDMWCKEEWGDAQCCEGLTCVPVDVDEGMTEWGMCLVVWRKTMKLWNKTMYSASFIGYHNRDTPFMMRGDYEIRPALNAWFQLWTTCAILM